MKKKLMVAFSCLFMGLTNSFCQEIKKPDVLIRFNFLGLADVLDNNLSSGVEYKFNERWSAGADAGWIFSSKYFRNAKGAGGLLFRPFIRLYPQARSNIFLEAELHYKRVVYTIEDWIGRLPVNGVAAYEEFTRFDYVKRAVGIHFRMGSQFNITDDKRLKGEVTGGIGYRQKKEYAKGGLYERNNIFSFSGDNDSGEQAGLALPLTVRLCYRLK